MAKKASDYKSLAQNPEKFKQMFWFAIQSATGIKGLAGPMGPNMFQSDSDGYMAPSYLDYLEKQDLRGAQQAAAEIDAETLAERAATGLIRIYKTACGEDSLTDADIQTITDFTENHNKEIASIIPFFAGMLDLEPEDVQVFKAIMYGEAGSRQEYAGDVASTLMNKAGSAYTGDLIRYQLDTSIGPGVRNREEVAGASSETISDTLKMMGRQGQLQVDELVGSPEQIMNKVVAATKDVPVTYTPDHFYSDKFIQNTVKHLGVDENYIAAQTKRNVEKKKQAVYEAANTDSYVYKRQGELGKTVGQAVGSVAQHENALEQLKARVASASNLDEDTNKATRIKEAVASSETVGAAMLALAQNNVTNQLRTEGDTENSFGDTLTKALTAINTQRNDYKTWHADIKNKTREKRIKNVEDNLKGIKYSKQVSEALVMQEDISSYVSQLSQMVPPDVTIDIAASNTEEYNKAQLAQKDKIIKKIQRPEDNAAAKAIFETLENVLPQYYAEDDNGTSLQQYARTYENAISTSADTDIRTDFTQFSLLMRNKDHTEKTLAENKKRLKTLEQTPDNETPEAAARRVDEKKNLEAQNVALLDDQKNIQTWLDTDKMKQVYSTMQQQYSNDALKKNLYPQLESVTLLEQAFQAKGEPLKKNEALSMLYNIVGDPAQLNPEEMVDRVNSFVTNINIDDRNGREIKASIAKGAVLAQKHNVDNSANVRSYMQQVGARSAAIGNKMGLSVADKDMLSTQMMSVSGLAANNASSRYMATANRFVANMNEETYNAATAEMPEYLKNLAVKLKNGNTASLTKQDFNNAQLLAQTLGAKKGYSASRVNAMSDTEETMTYYTEGIASMADKYVAEQSLFRGSGTYATAYAGRTGAKNIDADTVGRVSAMFGKEMIALLSNDKTRSEETRQTDLEALKIKYAEKLEQENQLDLADKITHMSLPDWEDYITDASTANQDIAKKQKMTIDAFAGTAKSLDPATIRKQKAYEATTRTLQKTLGLTKNAGIAALADEIAKPDGSLENGLFAFMGTQSFDMIKTDTGEIDKKKTRALAQAIVLHQTQSDKDELYGANIDLLEKLDNAQTSEEREEILKKTDPSELEKANKQLTTYQERIQTNQNKIENSVTEADDRENADAANAYTTTVTPVATAIAADEATVASTSTGSETGREAPTTGTTPVAQPTTVPPVENTAATTPANVTAVAAATPRDNEGGVSGAPGASMQLISSLVAKLRETVIPVEVRNTVAASIAGMSVQAGSASS